MSNNDTINVAVTGNDPDVVDAVSSVIHSSLSEAGFHNAVLIGDGSSEPIAQTDPEQSKSLLDMYQKSRPELFGAPIQIHTQSADAVPDNTDVSSNGSDELPEEVLEE